MNNLFRIFLLIVLILVLLAPQLSLYAQDDSPWGGIINEDGQVIADDYGLVTMDAAWMPSIPLLGNLQAEYHVYQAEDGTTMLQPNAITLFFMAMDPVASGLDQIGEHEILQTGLSLQIQTAGFLENTSPREILTNLLGISGLGESFTNEMADAILAGEDAWSIISFKDTQEIFRHLWFDSSFDQNLYTAMFIFEDCAISPIGCLPGMAAGEEEAEPQPQVTAPDAPIIPQCRAAEIVPGEILPSSEQVAPNYVLVTGQDDTKRGVDLCFAVDVLPTLYHVWQAEVVGQQANCGVEIGPWWQNRIDRGDATLADACPANQYHLTPIIRCVEHVYTLPESILSASAHANLSETSRDWILGELAISYPGARLIQPDWTFLEPAALGTSHWEYCGERIQVRDPGGYDMQICLQTSGTIVSEGRSGCLSTGSFKAYLIETTIIW